jgi:hypothetical protein
MVAMGNCKQRDVTVGHDCDIQDPEEMDDVDNNSNNNNNNNNNRLSVVQYYVHQTVASR